MVCFAVKLFSSHILLVVNPALSKFRNVSFVLRRLRTGFGKKSLHIGFHFLLALIGTPVHLLYHRLVALLGSADGFVGCFHLGIALCAAVVDSHSDIGHHRMIGTPHGLAHLFEVDWLLVVFVEALAYGLGIGGNTHRSSHA